mgnify:CR=1 FL=1
MMEILGVIGVIAIFAILVYIIPVWLLIKFDNEDPK